MVFPLQQIEQTNELIIIITVDCGQFEFLIKMN